MTTNLSLSWGCNMSSLLTDLPFLKDLVEVPRRQSGAMLGPLEGTMGGCTVHNSSDCPERYYCFSTKLWTLRYSWIKDKTPGYLTVAVAVQRWGRNPVDKHFVHPELMEQFILF